MVFRYKLEFVAGIAVLMFCIIFIYTSSTMTNAEFEGSDTIGSARIAEMTGNAEEEFQPFIWQWTPPSAEVESGIFALQAAIGGITVGWVFGYWKGQMKRENGE